jgi:hypothetical protein
MQTALADELRIDYDPETGECLGTLIEEARTNLLTYSEDFSNVAWTKSDAVVTPNTHTAPDGQLTMDTVAMGISSAVPYQIITLAAGTSYVISFYYHTDTSSAAIRCRISTETDSVSTWIDLATNSIGTKHPGFSSGGVSVLSSSLRRGWVVYTPAAGDEGERFLSISGVLGDGSGTADGSVVLWGAQLEAGAFPTSYIPTTTAAVTRNADVITMTGVNFSDWYNQSEGCLFVNVNRLSPVNINFAPASIGTGVSDFLTIQNLSTNSQWTTRARATGDNPFVTTALLGTDTPAKIAFGMSRTEYTASINGAAVVTYSPSGTPVYPEANSLKIGTNQTVSTPTGAGHIKQLQYYPRRLTNTQLQALSA